MKSHCVCPMYIGVYKQFHKQTKKYPAVFYLGFVFRVGSWNFRRGCSLRLFSYRKGSRILLFILFQNTITLFVSVSNAMGKKTSEENETLLEENSKSKSETFCNFSDNQ